MTAGVSRQDQGLTDQQRQEAEAAALAAQRQQETLEHAQQRAQLEEATLPLMLDAMWAANVLDIETTLRHVCKKVHIVTMAVSISQALTAASSAYVLQTAASLHWTA